MVVVFPAAKLAYILVRQIGKPFATRIKQRAKEWNFFKNYICMPPAQFYHWVEVNVKMRMLNLGKPTEVPKLNEAMAIELGAELLGEGIIFVVAAACLVAEYRRSSNKEREKEEAKEAKIKELGDRIMELELKLEEHSTRMRELNRVTFGIHTSFSKWWSTNNDDSVDSPGDTSPSPTLKPMVSKGIILQAIDELERSVKGGPYIR